MARATCFEFIARKRRLDVNRKPDGQRYVRRAYGLENEHWLQVSDTIAEPRNENTARRL